jgi:hypothetical protein
MAYTSHQLKVKRGKYKCVEGKFIPKNKDKFMGEGNPIYKSRLEYRMMLFLDKSPSVVAWNYESIVIPYIDPTKYGKHKRLGRQRKYYVDFIAKIKKSDGSIKTTWIEVKSHDETIPPKPPTKRKSKKNIKLENDTWKRNNAKWKSARKHAEGRDCEFVIITENQLK